MTDKIGSFRFLTGDVNYTDHGGKWYRKVTETRYHVIELMNWESVDSSARQELGATYNVSLSEIDLGLVSARDALRSCGFEIEEKTRDVIQSHDGETVAKFGSEAWPLVLVECLYGHGNKAPLHDENGNNWRKLFREAIKESRSLDDPRAHADALNRPVNRIGSTAREYMQGDITNPILRGEESGNPEAKLLGKMYRAAGGRTLGGEVIDLGPAPKE